MSDGYKVVYVRKRLWSAIYNWPTGVVEYAVGMRTTRHIGCGPLGVFIDLAAAREFVEAFSHDPLAIYRCRYEPSADRGFWTDSRYKVAGVVGSHFADWVKLVSLVY